MKTDLHVHTHFSDGVHSVEEIFKKAKEAGITTIAITDHNWTDHIANNQEKALEFELDYIQGVEISATFEGENVHILAYSKNFNLKKLSSGLNRQIEGFTNRSQEITNRINNSGKIKIDFKKLRGEYKGCIQNFPIMIQVGKALGKPPLGEESKTFYKKYCIPCGDWFMSPEQVIKIIHESNGIAVLAHPAIHWNKMGRQKFGRLFKLLLKCGLNGLEAIHSNQNEGEEKEIITLAHKHDLLITGGSDFHGLAVSPSRHLGAKSISEEQLAKFLEKLNSIKK